jgi:hypothetical protein
MAPHQRVEVHAVEQLHGEVEGVWSAVTPKSYSSIVWGERSARDDAGLGCSAEARHGLACAVRADGGAGAERVGANQLDRRRAREHAMRGPVDLTHAAPAEQRAEFVTAHLARPRDLLPEARDDVRDDDGHRHEQEVGYVHQERVGGRLERPGAAGARDEHRQGIHRDRDEPGHQGLPRRARHQGGKHQQHHAGPRNAGRDRGMAGHRIPVDHQRQQERRHDEVAEAEIEDGLRAPAAAARVGVKGERHRRAAQGHRVGRTESLPLQTSGVHRARGHVSEHGAHRPEHRGHERQRPETPRRAAQEVVGERSPFRARSRGRGRGPRGGLDQPWVCHQGEARRHSGCG